MRELPPERRSGLRWVWSLGGLKWRELAARVYREANQDDVLGHAAQLSYYFLFALFPLLIVLSTLLGYFFASEGDLYSRLMAYLQRVMPGPAFEVMRGAIRDLTSGASGTKLSLGLLVAIWSASAGLNALIKGLNLAYDVRELRPWYRRRWVALNMTLALAVLVTSALIMLVWGDNIGSWLAARWSLGEWFRLGWSLAQWALVIGLVLLALNLLYVFGPNLREHRFVAFLPGSIVALALWLLASVGFKAYLEHFGSYAKTYGSLGAIIALLILLYLTALAILIGGEVNSEVRKAAASAGAPEAQTPIEGPD